MSVPVRGVKSGGVCTCPQNCVSGTITLCVLHIFRPVILTNKNRWLCKGKCSDYKIIKWSNVLWFDSVYQKVIFAEESLGYTKVSKIQRKKTTFLTYHVKATCIWHPTTVLCLLTSKLHSTAWYSSQLLLLICDKMRYNCLMKVTNFSLGFLLPLHYIIIFRQVEIQEAVQGLCRTVNIISQLQNLKVSRCSSSCFLKCYWIYLIRGLGNVIEFI